MAKAALTALPNSCLLWMPAACSPFKTEQKMVSEEHRYAMCCLVAKGDSRMAVSDLEFSLPKPSYTIDTVRRLVQDKKDDYYFLCGADAFLSLFRWKEIESLVKLVRFLVVARKDFSEVALWEQKEKIEQIGGSVQIVAMEEHPVSSTELRQKLLQGDCKTQYLPEEIFNYIQENRLYRE